MRYIRATIPVIVSLLLLLACRKDEQEQITPVEEINFSVKLGKVEQLNVADLALEAEMETDMEQVVKYGFIVSEFETPILERGKVVHAGAARERISYSHVYTKLDTGTMYHIRAFAQLEDSTVYSQIQSFHMGAPSILEVSPMEISNPSWIYISTDIRRLNRDQQVSIYLDQHPLKLASTYISSTGIVFQAELPYGLHTGSYTLSLMVNDMRMTYKEKVTLLPGKWVKVLDLPYNDWNSTTTFVHNEWVYVLQYKSDKTEFFKQNYRTGNRVNLTPFKQEWFLSKPAILVEQSSVHFLGGVEYIGNHEGNTTSKHLIYHLQDDLWSEEREIPADARTNAVSGLYGGKLYFGLGYDLPPSSSIGAVKLKNDLWAYDLQTKNWERIADFPQLGRRGSASFMVGPQLHIVGGYERSRATKENWCYDVRTDSWSRKSDYPGKGYTGFTGFALDGSGYVGLGEIGIYATVDTRELYRTFFRYNPVSDSWSRVSDFYGIVPDNKYATADKELGLLIGTDGLYSGKSLHVYTFIP